MEELLISKFVEIERAITYSQRQPFKFFGLIHRTSGLGGWDVVVSAEWGDDNSRELMSAVVKEVQTRLTQEELREIVRVVDVDTSSEFVKMMSFNYITARNIVPPVSYFRFNTFSDEGEVLECYIILPDNNSSLSKPSDASELQIEGRARTAVIGSTKMIGVLDA